MTRVKLPMQSEAQIKRAVQDLLKARGIMCFRLNSGNFFASYKGKTRRIMGNPSGTADLLAVFNRKMRLILNGIAMGFAEELCQELVWIELKRVGARQSPEQKVFQQMVEKEGHTYLLIHSAAELNDWLSKNT